MQVDTIPSTWTPDKLFFGLDDGKVILRNTIRNSDDAKITILFNHRLEIIDQRETKLLIQEDKPLKKTIVQLTQMVREELFPSQLKETHARINEAFMNQYKKAKLSAAKSKIIEILSLALQNKVKEMFVAVEGTFEEFGSIEKHFIGISEYTTRFKAQAGENCILAQNPVRTDASATRKCCLPNPKPCSEKKKHRPRIFKDDPKTRAVVYILSKDVHSPYKKDISHKRLNYSLRHKRSKD
jgi:hypothetical protein